MAVRELATTCISRMAMNIPMHIAPNPSHSRRALGASGSGGAIEDTCLLTHLAAHGSPPSEDRREHSDQLRGSAAAVIVHRQPGEHARRAQPRRELPLPGACVIRAGRRAVAEQVLRQQPGGLHGHADAFGDDGMGLTGHIARKEPAVLITAADARSYRTAREYGVLDRCVPQRAPCAGAARQDMAQYRLARPATLNLAELPQGITADAAGQRDAAAITVNHAAIASWKGEQRHHTRRQCRAAKSALEGKQVGGSRWRSDGEGTAGIPGPAGHYHGP